MIQSEKIKQPCLIYIVNIGNGGFMIREVDYEKIGKRVREARHKKGWTQEQLSKVTGISQPHLGHVESGKTKVALPTLVKIANALDASMDQLLFDSMEVLTDSYDLDFRNALAECTDEEKEHLLEILKLQIKYFKK